ncbi:hypothetical protein L7F22_045382 [Adiantum nelumboides]|nr:hypothetical protein [Adiantum nelumboides]
MDVSSCISKWLIRLQEFEYTVQVESSTRASLAGILTHRHFEKKVKPQGEEVLPPPEPVRLEEAHSLYFDGAYKRTIDKAAAGMVVLDEEGKRIFSTGELLETSHSNNEAEYAALILGLKWCVNIKIHRLNVYGDAMLLVMQIKGIWACKNHNLLNHLKQVKELMHHFQAVAIHHVPRMENQEVDALAGEQLLGEVVVGAIVLKEPLFQGSDFMQDIVDFLNFGECPSGLTKGQRQWLDVLDLDDVEKTKILEDDSDFEQEQHPDKDVNKDIRVEEQAKQVMVLMHKELRQRIEKLPLQGSTPDADQAYMLLLMLPKFCIEGKSYILLTEVQMLLDLREDYGLGMLARYVNENHGFVEEDSFDDERLETNPNTMKCLRYCFE